MVDEVFYVCQAKECVVGFVDIKESPSLVFFGGNEPAVGTE